MRKIRYKVLFSKKDVASEDKGYHTLSDLTKGMKHENTESFAITRTDFKILQIIERETKVPMGVQLIHAHTRWAAAKDRQIRKRSKK